MKSLHFIFCIASLLCFSCTARGGGSKLPEKRPDNFSITFYEGGGMLPESETYFVTEDSAGRESFFQQSNNRWVFLPEKAKLDDFYNKVRALNPTDIRARDKGTIQDRGGVSMQVSYENVTVNAVNSGGSFVVDEDQQRFNDIYALVADFVSDGLHSRLVPVKFFIEMSVGDTTLESCSIRLSREEVMSWEKLKSKDLASEYILDALPGQYHLNAWANVGSRSLSLDEDVEISAANHDFRILLKSDTFEFKQQ
jgi:hypothetical protein